MNCHNIAVSQDNNIKLNQHTYNQLISTLVYYILHRLILMKLYFLHLHSSFLKADMTIFIDKQVFRISLDIQNIIRFLSVLQQLQVICRYYISLNATGV